MNPKINNMITGYEAAKFDLVLINDSAIKSKHIDQILYVRLPIILPKQTKLMHLFFPS